MKHTAKKTTRSVIAFFVSKSRAIKATVPPKITSVRLIWQTYGGRDLEFIIRQCQIGDETALSLLGKATFLETYAGTAEAADILAHVETEHSAESYRTWLHSDTAKIWVAETSVGRSAIGYAVALTSQNNGFCVEMEIKRFYVLYRFHRSGLGHSLMNEVLATARKNRIAGLFLKVEKANQNAINFYSRIGFRVVGEKPFRAGERDYAVLVMRLAFRDGRTMQTV